MSRASAAPAFLLALLTAAACSTRTAPAVDGVEPIPMDCLDAAVDSDDDGISDSCELHIAQSFAPFLNMPASGCNIVEQHGARRVGGGYLYAVGASTGGVRVAYMPAYFIDCGWSGVKCRLPGVDCSRHAGDSEMIVVDLAAAAGSWQVTGVFLSAHCFGRSTGACRWYRSDELTRFAWMERAPVVWVANGRNANYPTRGACEAGHWWIDTCAGERVVARFPVAAARNIGSRSAPAHANGCIRADEIDEGTRTVAGARECMWRADARFRGWQESGEGVTPYSRYLQQVVGM